MDLNDLNKVWEVKPLKMVREDEARQILEKVAKQVQPIMKKRKWKVKILSEFWPSNPALLGLNVNGGEEVKLRLRRQNNEWDFFSYEQILDTMLHELCHNQFGPHNADFYNLLDEIRKECEELMAKGITGGGQGFDLRGKRLGGYSRQPPLSSLRQKALSAAENRVKRGSLLPSGPKRVGGDSSMRDVLTPVQAAAMAAERRLHDDLWCASQQVKERPETSSKEPASQEDEALPYPLVSSHGEEEPKPSWQCGICTLLNQPLALICEACGTQRIEEKVMKTATAANTNTITNTKMWSCKFCTLQNSVTTERCVACGEWKYSYGPPTATRGPYLGT
ncbi:DNA-dependent metalloprotease WSS1-like [Rutidosis leptorrhynchoides]|uniref:DNA-dependent metalloprotease WSS1-like n=1 Tax=Rutidosis leptorrhynchoides TaxID=125765 RepID=UPI003A993037